MCADHNEEQKEEVMKRLKKRSRLEINQEKEREERVQEVGDECHEEDGNDEKSDLTKSPTMENGDEYATNYIKGFKIMSSPGLKLVRVNLDFEDWTNQQDQKPGPTTINLIIEVTEEFPLRLIFPSVSMERPQGKLVQPGFMFLELNSMSGVGDQQLRVTMIQQRKEFYEKLFVSSKIQSLIPGATKDNTLVVLVFNGHDPVEVEQLFMSQIYQSATIYLSNVSCSNWKSAFEVKKAYKLQLQEEFVEAKHEASASPTLQEAYAVAAIQETSTVRVAAQLVREVKLRFKIGQSEAQIIREMEISASEWQGQYSTLIPPLNSTSMNNRHRRSS
jgi:hypothetical protein